MRSTQKVPQGKPAAAPARIQPNTHLAGEFFVAAELCKRGYQVALTLGNAKAVDLVVEKDGATVTVQVKAIARAKSVGWPLSMDKTRIPLGRIYICVVLNEIGEPPDYYVLPADEILRLGKWYRSRAMLDIGPAKRAGYREAWHLMDRHLGAQGS